jgi:ABC-2 type transport system ATP-binding protein
MSAGPCIVVSDLSHAYGERLALDRVSLTIAAGESFALLGPNGGGKSTLLRLLATSLRPQSGRAIVAGADVASEPDAVRARIGVTFQSPSLDGRLTVRENLRCQGWLYGISGARLQSRIEQVASELAVADRLEDRVEQLSGGLKRRVEIAKSLLHEPRVLLLDEPSTGLDPGVRRELWDLLGRLKDAQGLTILVTSHLLDEAERCDRVGLLDSGRLAAVGTPTELRSAIGGECLTLTTDDPAALGHEIRQRFGLESRVVAGQVRIETSQGAALVERLMRECGDRIGSMTLARPSLEDVFIHYTNRRLEG